MSTSQPIPHGQPGQAPPFAPTPNQAPPVPPTLTLVQTAATLLPETREEQRAGDVARLLTADLLLFMQDGDLNLAYNLGVPIHSNPKRLADVYLQQPHLFAEVLIADLERLFEDDLVSGVQLAFVAPNGWRRNAETGEVVGALLGQVYYQRSGYSELGAPGQRMRTRASRRHSSRRRSSGVAGRSQVAATPPSLSMLIDEIYAQQHTQLLLLLEWNRELDRAASSPCHRPTYLFEWMVGERGGAPLSRAIYRDGAFRMRSVAVQTSETMQGQLM